MRSLRILCVALFAAFIGTLASAVYLDLKFASEMPRLPEPTSGRIVETQVMHGTKVYVTPEELKLQWVVQRWLFDAGLLCLVGAGVLNVRFRLFRTRSNE